MKIIPDNEPSLQRASDRELIKRRHEEGAFRELVDRYASLVWGVSFRILGDSHEAEDVCQDTFLILFQKCDRLRVSRTIGGWLYGVAYRKARRMVEKRKRHREERLVADPTVDGEVLAQLCVRHEQLTFDEELRSLPERYREPLILHFLVGKSIREVAKQLGLSEHAIEGRLRRGKLCLRGRLLRRGLMLSAVLPGVSSTHKAIETELLVDSIVCAVSATHASEICSADPFSLASLAAKEKLLMYRLVSVSVAAVVLLIALAGATSFLGAAPQRQTILRQVSPVYSNWHRLLSSQVSQRGTFFVSAGSGRSSKSTQPAEDREAASTTNEPEEARTNGNTEVGNQLKATGTRENSIGRLRQLTIALHDYHAAHGNFPPSAVYDEDGTALLSWRVLLLPFLNKDAFYKAFNLGEPWDSPHNKKLVRYMPSVFKSASPEGKTRYLAIAGSDTIFSGATGTDMRKIADGTSNTIVLIEAPEHRAVTWTEPTDINYRPTNPHDGLIDPEKEGFMVAFADGTVRFVRNVIRKETLNSLASIADGEPIDTSQLQPIIPMQPDTVRRLRDLGTLLVLDSNGWISSAQLLAKPYSQADQDDDLQTLLQMEGRGRLKSLSIRGPRFGNTSLEMIGKFRSLTSLHLAGADVNDAGLAHLEPLRRLETLMIRECNITDDAVLHLKKLSTLKRLTISQLSDEAIQQLKEELPACTIRILHVLTR